MADADHPLVRIVAIPAGEAPFWVRACWVGLELPLAMREPRTMRGRGVVSGPRNRLLLLLALALGRGQKARGYVVPSAVALAVLRAAHPEAAAWWAEHAPHFLQPRRYFLFQEQECRPVVPATRVAAPSRSR